ncbi:hypothetical protein [Ravibacter arvi]
MPHTKGIRSFFCWMVATILLVVSIGFPTVSPEAGTSSHEITRQKEGKAASETPSEQTEVRALTLDAVVISVFSFHFSQYFLPAPQLSTGFPELASAIFAACFSEPLFFFSYFQKVFGKQIAANAP